VQDVQFSNSPDIVNLSLKKSDIEKLIARQKVN